MAEQSKTKNGIGCLMMVVSIIAIGAVASHETPHRPPASQPTPASDEDKKAAAEEAEQIASGQHCLSGWDGSLPSLKDAVKEDLRNPRSFEHVETIRGPVNKKGKFGVLMKYRAQNGFGGVNVEYTAAEVDAATCEIRIVDTNRITRLMTGGSL